MTRTRATEDNLPTPLMVEYYGQRATAGLIVTECTAVSEQGKGVINGPSPLDPKPRPLAQSRSAEPPRARPRRVSDRKDRALISGHCC